MSSGRRKLLILLDWFAPGYKAGGPIRSGINLVLALKNDYDIYVLTTDTDHGETEPYNSVQSNKWIKNDELGIHVFYVRKQTASFSQVKDEIVTINADVVYLNLLFSPMFVIFPLWLKYKNIIKGKVILCPRGSLYESALSLKSYKKKPFLLFYKWLGISNIVTFHATNKREETAIQKYFPGSKIIVANNLPNIAQPAFETCLKIPGVVRCVFIARIVAIKNLRFLLTVLQAVKSKVELTIVGPIEDEKYWADCKAEMTKLDSQHSVNYLGPQKNEALAAIVQKHHLFVLPTTGENFGHSIFEALLAGRPVLISDQTPWLNLKEQKAGWDISLGNPAQFTMVIEKVAGFDQADFDTSAKNAWLFARDFISNPALIKDYKQLFS